VQAQKEPRKKRHEPGVGLRKTAESQLQSAVTNRRRKPDPNQIVDEERLFQDHPQSNLNFPTSLPQNLFLLQPQFLRRLLGWFEI
jgi:hypothetical protein